MFLSLYQSVCTYSCIGALNYSAAQSVQSTYLLTYLLTYILTYLYLVNGVLTENRKSLLVLATEFRKKLFIV